MLKENQKVSLIIFDINNHLSYLEKWMLNSELMEGWGGRPMAKDKVLELVREPNSLFLMIYTIDVPEPIGFVCFYSVNLNKKIASRGTMIDHKFQGNGYGKVAIKASNKYIRKHLGIERIELWVKDGNDRSLHITKSLGYKYDYFDKKHNIHYFYMNI